MRDPFAEERFPDDPYGLTPASLAALDPALAEMARIWGAAKAMTHRRATEVVPDLIVHLTITIGLPVVRETVHFARFSCDNSVEHDHLGQTDRQSTTARPRPGTGRRARCSSSTPELVARDVAVGFGAKTVLSGIDLGFAPQHHHRPHRADRAAASRRSCARSTG